VWLRRGLRPLRLEEGFCVSWITKLISSKNAS